MVFPPDWKLHFGPFYVHPDASKGGEGRWDLALDVMMCLERHGQPQGLQGTWVGPKRAGQPAHIELELTNKYSNTVFI